MLQIVLQQSCTRFETSYGHVVRVRMAEIPRTETTPIQFNHLPRLDRPERNLFLDTDQSLQAIENIFSSVVQ